MFKKKYVTIETDSGQMTYIPVAKVNMVIVQDSDIEIFFGGTTISTDFADNRAANNFAMKIMELLP